MTNGDKNMSVQNLATPVLHDVGDAAKYGISAEDFINAMHCNPQGDVWRNSDGVLLHDCGNCGRARTTNGDCECSN